MKTLKYSFLALLLVFSTSNFTWASTAHDDASQSAYTDGWDDGDNGGTGFGPWSLSFDGDTGAINPIYSADPHFIDGVGVGPLAGNLLGAPAFGLTTDTSVSAAAEARRDFAAPLKVGEVFSVEIDGSALEGSGRIGNIFELLGADGVPRYTLRTSLGSVNDHWTVNGTETPIDASDALRVSFSLTSPDNYSGNIRSLTQPIGNFSLNSPLIGTNGAEITGLRFAAFGTGSSVDGAREMFFDNLEITRAEIPEPTALLLAISAVGMTLALRRRHKPNR